MEGKVVASFEMFSHATDAACCEEFVDRAGECGLDPRAVSSPAEDPSGSLLKFGAGG